MKLKVNSIKSKRFRDIKIGECFYYAGENKDIILMKTEELQGVTGLVFNAVSIEFGRYYNINEYSQAEYDLVKAYICIES